MTICVICGREVYNSYIWQSQTIRQDLNGQGLCYKCAGELDPQLGIKSNVNISPDSYQGNKSSTGDFSTQGMIRASSVIQTPSIVTELTDKYMIIYDQALLSIKFDNIVKAINIMANKGWKCVNITSFNNAGSGQHITIPVVDQLLSQSIYMYALMEKLEIAKEEKS